MAEQRNSTFLTVNVTRKVSLLSPQDMIETPSISSAKRRKSKLLSNRRTNDELIQESHQELLKYVDVVDARVKEILHAHQGQFLEAYRAHVKKVRDQMETLRRQSSQNTNSEQVHLERIDALEKQLSIFREESLSLFQKLVAREKEIAELNRRAREVQAENRDSRKSLQNAMKRNKDLEAALLKLQMRQGQVQNTVTYPATMRQEIQSSQDKSNALISPLLKNLLAQNSIDKRPSTTANYSHGKSITLRVQSNQKFRKPLELHQLKAKIQQKSGSSPLISVDTVIQLLQEPPTDAQKKSLASFRIARQKLYSKAISRRKSSFREDPALQAQSQQLAQRTDYLCIFKRCVGEIKKDIMRKNNIPSLNFFKQNGPRDFIQFKKVENYLLLELFLRDEQVLNKFYDLLYRGQ